MCLSKAAEWVERGCGLRNWMGKWPQLGSIWVLFVSCIRAGRAGEREREWGADGHEEITPLAAFNTKK